MPNKHNMPAYQGKKDCYAKPLSLGEYNKLQGWPMPEGQDPEREGYLVEYFEGGAPNHPDYEGYISWSPKEIFEGSYNPIETPLDRLKIESIELDARATGLGAYIASGKHVDLGRLQAGLLSVQFDQMDAYSKILHLRKMFMDGPVEMCNYGSYKHPSLFEGVKWQVAQYMAEQGFTILRKGWNGNGMFATYSPGQKALPADKFWIAANKEAAEANGGFMDVAPYFALKTAQNTIQMGWVPSIGDLSANDWVVLL